MQVGDVMHCRQRLIVFWSCPIISYFWKEIITRANMVLNTAPILLANMCVLGYIPTEFKLHAYSRPYSNIQNYIAAVEK